MLPVSVPTVHGNNMDIRDSDGGVVSQRSHVASSDAFRADSTAPVLNEQPLDDHVEFLIMGGYEEADVPDGMESLIGTAGCPPRSPRTDTRTVTHAKSCCRMAAN